MSLPRRQIDWKRFDAHKASGGSDAAFANAIGMDPRNFHQYKKTRHKDEPTLVDVTLDTIDLKTPSSTLPVHPSTPNGTPASAGTLVHPSTPAWQDHETRLQVLEAFIASLQAEQYTSTPPVHRSVPAMREWKKTGATVAADMLDAIDAYAAQHRLEKREVLDLALRTFFAPVAEEVHDA
jgi:hypothetical protein